MVRNQAITNFFAIVSRGNYADYLEGTGLDTKLSQIKCWWNNEITKCSDEFKNSVMENNDCFVFNQNSTAVAGGNFLLNGNSFHLNLKWPSSA